MPDADQRDRLLATWFRVVLDALLTHGESYCVGDAAGAALWVRSRKLALLSVLVVVLAGAVASGLFYQRALRDKDVDAVVDVVHRAGLSKKVARCRPIGVIKG